MANEGPNVKGNIAKAETSAAALTERQRQIFDMIVKGFSSAQMSERLGIKPSRVNVRNISRTIAGAADAPKANLLFEKWEDVEKFEIEPDLLHHGLVKSLEKITSVLSSWDDASLEWLAKNLESGDLKKIRHGTGILRNQTTPPHAPPNGESYVLRQDKKEDAPSFIGRVYGQWLTGEFTRADLRKVDPQAVQGLINWERIHGRAELNLPTVKERNDRQLADSATRESIRTNPNGRLRSALARRER